MRKIIITTFIALTFFQSFCQVPSYVDTNGLVGWYPFNGNADNAYGTGHNGVVLGPIPTTDRFGATGAAYHFNGMADHILIDTAFFNVGWHNYTVSWWMKNDTVYNPFSAASAGSGDQCALNTIPEDGLAIDVNWGHSMKYSVWVNSNPSLYTVWNILPGSQSHDSVISTASHGIEPIQWQHFAIVKENDTAYHFYINGQLDTTFRTTVTALNYYCRFNIGNLDSTEPHEGVLGSLDDYGIWTRNLSACDIKRLSQSTQHLFVTTQPANDTVHTAATATFRIADIGTGNTYRWQENTGSGFINVPASAPYSGVTTPTLTITGVTAAMTGYQFRCVVNGSAGCADTSSGGRLVIGSGAGIYSAGANNISVTPNPTTGHISIMGAGKVNVRMFNSIGQLVRKIDQVDALNISDLPSGVYFIHLTGNSGSLIYSQRLVKK